MACLFQIDGEVLDSYTAESDLYSASEYQPFWLRISNRGRIRVGRGTECDERTVIMSAQTPLRELINNLAGYRLVFKCFNRHELGLDLDILACI